MAILNSILDWFKKPEAKQEEVTVADAQPVVEAVAEQAPIVGDTTPVEDQETPDNSVAVPSVDVDKLKALLKVQFGDIIDENWDAWTQLSKL
jgi:hypothetical protein